MTEFIEPTCAQQRAKIVAAFGFVAQNGWARDGQHTAAHAILHIKECGDSGCVSLLRLIELVVIDLEAHEESLLIMRPKSPGPGSNDLSPVGPAQ